MRLATAASAILGLAMICSALFWLFTPPPSISEQEAGPRNYTTAELARHDGVDGHDCLVAVDGDVYRIRGFALWSMGRHTPSDGQARCGLDLTDVIDESPHGRSKLRLLEKVGILEPR